MSTSISDFSASGPSFSADVLSGSSSGPPEGTAGESSASSSAFAQAFAQKLADLAAQRRAQDRDTAQSADDAARRQEVAAESDALSARDSRLAKLAGLENTDGSAEGGTDGAQRVLSDTALVGQIGPTDPTDPLLTGLDASAWAAQAAAAAAAATSAASAASATPSWAAGLTTVAVSPGLNVIQPAQSELDGQSLVAFARAQGLDDRAVQWLFGSQGSQATVRSTATAAGLAEVLEGAQTTLPGQPGVPLQTQTSLQVQTQLQAQVASLSSAAVAQDAAGSLSGAELQAVAQATAQATSQAAASAASLSASAPQGSPGFQAAASLTGGNTALTAAAAASAASAEAQQAALTLNWLRDASAQTSSSLWGPPGSGTTPVAREAGLNSQEVIAAALQVSKSLLSNSSRVNSTSGPNSRPATPASRPMNGTLDLTASLDPEWVEWLEVRAGAAATSGAAGRQKASAASAALASFEGGAARILAQWAKADPAAPPSPATAAGAESSAAASSTSFVPSGHLGTGQATAKMASAGLEGTLANAQDRAQRLADRLGEAVGQRMLTELEKGNWHLNLKLRPESLGSIEIEMRMHAGQLNAQFTAHQALTRDLLSDGINRLKDMLAQMGMNVAQMNVNGGRSQQRGGDSTPRQSQGVRAPEATSNNQETDAKNPSQRSALLSGSGWDMLV